MLDTGSLMIIYSNRLAAKLRLSEISLRLERLPKLFARVELQVSQ